MTGACLVCTFGLVVELGASSSGANRNRRRLLRCAGRVVGVHGGCLRSQDIYDVGVVQSKA